MRVFCALAAAAALAMPGVAMAQLRLLGVDTSGNNLVEINPATGAATVLGPIIGATGTVGGLAYDAATDTLYLSSTGNDNLWRLDYNTRVATLIGNFNVGSTVVMHGLEWHSGLGTLFGHSSSAASGATFFEINPATGQATPVATSGISGFGSMGYVASTNTMYIADTVGDRLLTIDVLTGATTVVGPYGIAASNQIGIGMAYAPELGMFATDNNTDSLYRLDLATGAATLIGAQGTSNVLSLVFVPTPSTAVLLGLGGVALARRRR